MTKVWVVLFAQRQGDEPTVMGVFTTEDLAERCVADWYPDQGWVVESDLSDQPETRSWGKAS